MNRCAVVAAALFLLGNTNGLEAGFWDWIGWKEEVPVEPGVNQVQTKVIDSKKFEEQKRSGANRIERKAPSNRKGIKGSSSREKSEQQFPWESQSTVQKVEIITLPDDEEATASANDKCKTTSRSSCRSVSRETTIPCTAACRLPSSPSIQNRHLHQGQFYGCNSRCNPPCCSHGIFMPSCKPLFPEFLADPRAIILSAGWRFNDDCFAPNMVDVSYGQACPLYRWTNVFCCGDALQLDIQGALWALFDHLNESAPLVNADYYVGFPVTWACGQWSARFRVYHISSHIGDEYLLMNPNFDRRNPSAEYADLYVAYKPNPDMRFFGGYGYILHRDNSYRVHHNYFGWGLETYMPMFRWNLSQHCVLGQPYFAMFIRSLEEDHWKEDATYVLGYEFKKYSGCGGRLRLFLEFHTGASLEGQFSRCQTDYLSFRVSYAY